MLARADGIRGCPTNLVKNNGSKGDDVNYAPCDNPGTQYQGKYAIEMAGESRRVGKRSNLLLQGDILSVAFNKAGKTSGTFGFGSKDTPFTLYMHPAQSTEGGARRKSKTPKNKAPKWVSTGRRAALKDGSKRVVFQNNSGTGELRYKKYVVRAGKRVATYVKFK